MRQQTCCFTGHRFIPEVDREHLEIQLYWTVRDLALNHGVKYFGVGGALGFDTMAAEAVLRQREQLGLKLIVVVPCGGQERRWKPADQKKYRDILQRADKVRVLADHYYDGCMQVRNRHLVDNSGWCVCYLTKNHGGTFYTVGYARHKELDVINLATKIKNP